VTLTNVVIVNDQPSAGTAVTNFATLAPGEVQTFSGSYTTASNTCSVTDTLTASGNSDCDGQSVEDTDTATCTLTGCEPAICVTKGIACVSAVPNGEGGYTLECVSGTGSFEKDAYGVRGDSNPAFCYGIVVQNCGSVDLTNVVVNDSKLGTVTNIALLPVGASVTNHLLMSWNSTTTNTVTADGQSIINGSHVNDNDFAVAHVAPAGIACNKYVSLEGGPLVNAVTLPAGTDTNHPYTVVWYVQVTNNGSAALTNVEILDKSLNLSCDTSVVLDGTLDVGQSSDIIPVCTNVFTSCNFNSLVNTVEVRAKVDAQGTNCIWDINGSNVVVHSQCEASVNPCEAPVGCRVTGGTRIDAPLVWPADIRYATHGGQLGAPFAVEVCTVQSNYYPGNTCIKGEWEHVRHYKGGTLGNFHTRYFDTHECACLDTNVGPGGAYGPGTLIGDVCNPDDRASGPAPRPAPANKIAFSGIGDYALDNGKKAAQSVLFRVDIEDRSEPGGAHPKGGKAPADRYRIRIWILTPSELSQLTNGTGADPYLLNFRNKIGACNGINVRDGADVPNGAVAFGVRRPDIDDGGQDDDGNMQIHPSIQDCK